MTLNRQRMLRFAEYAAVSASVAGVVVAVVTRQLAYAAAPLSITAALNIANRRQWERRIEQRLTQNITQVDQRLHTLSSDFVRQTDFDAANSMLGQLRQSLEAIEALNLQENFVRQTDFNPVRNQLQQLQQSLETLNIQENFVQRTDFDAANLVLSQLKQSLEIIEALNLQENFVRRTAFDPANQALQQLQQSLAALESLTLEAIATLPTQTQMQSLADTLQAQQRNEQLRVDAAIANISSDFSQLSQAQTQLSEQVTSLSELLTTAQIVPPSVSPPETIVDRPMTAAVSARSIQWIAPQLPVNDDFSLEINLGIDFGTGFTKVCFRDLASNHSEIVSFFEASDVELEQALLSTKIAILEDGTLLSGLTAAEWNSNTQPIQKSLEFIKMRLAHLDFPEKSEWRLERIPELDDPDTVEHICAYYLSRVITRAQSWIQENRADLFKNQTVRWSFNIGVPVEYCDSPSLQRFQRVLSLAWLLTNTPSSSAPLTLQTLNQLGTYLRDWMQENLDQELDCFTTPEIAAAVWSFLSSRQAVEKFYTFFDFGDGTLDGTAFRFWRENGGELKVDFYAGQVRPLGVTAFTQQTASELQTSPDTVRQALLEWQAIADKSLHTGMHACKTRKDVQKLVGFVVMEGNAKHQENRGPIIANDELGDQLDVFVGGGGGHNLFFQNTVQATYEDFQQRNAGIPPYCIKRIPVPDDLLMNGLEPEEFHRFAVAYGLCIPEWEGPKIRLPSAIECHEQPDAGSSLGDMPRYEDLRGAW